MVTYSNPPRALNQKREPRGLGLWVRGGEWWCGHFLSSPVAGCVSIKKQPF